MRWLLVLLLGVVLMAVPAVVSLGQDKDKKDKPKDEESYVKVEVKGKVQTGVMAIGGETTGTLIATKEVTLELDLSGNKELAKEAEKLNGKVAVVTGTLYVKGGVEIKRQRYIVKVATIKAAEEKK